MATKGESQFLLPGQDKRSKAYSIKEKLLEI